MHSYFLPITATAFLVTFFGASPGNAEGAEPLTDNASAEEATGAPAEAEAPPIDETEETGQPEDEMDEPDEPAERTPMSLASFAPFGESQRATPTVANPSFPSLSDRRFRFGTLLDFGAGYEIGDVDDDWLSDMEDLFDDFEDLEERTMRFRESFEQGVTPPPSELEALRDNLIDFRDDANVLVDELTTKAYAKLMGNASFPLTPIAVRSDSLRGTFSLNADGFMEARGGVFSTGDAFGFDLRDDDEITGFRREDGVEIIETARGDVPIEAEPEAGIAVQGGAVGRIGAGYSRAFLESDRGALHAGTSLNFFRASLVRTGVLFDEDDFGDAVEDAFDDSDKTSTGFGVDLGASWVNQNYLVGGVVRNINEPSFDYPDTRDNEFFTANPHARRNGSRWKMERLFTLQAATFTADQRWVASAAVDLNGVSDTTGDDYQWLSVLGSFEPERTWVPSPRIGMRTNLTGEKLTYVNAGLSFFRALHLDISSTLDTVDADGDNIPRGFQVNLGLGRRF